MPLEGGNKMRNKELFTKTCLYCGLIFRTDNPDAKYCHTCQKKGKAAEIKPKRRITSPVCDLTLGAFCGALERYNARHRTCYTYGQAVALIYGGHISRKEFLKR